MALQRLFERFTPRPVEPGLRVPGELARCSEDYVLEPQRIDGMVLRRDALPSDADSYAVGVVTKKLFGLIPVDGTLAEDAPEA